MNGPSIIGAQRFSNDDGSADPLVRERLAAYDRGEASERKVLAALGTRRVLVPVLAAPAEENGASTDRNSDVTLPLISGPEGRRGVPAFTSAAALQAWRPDARPVPLSTAEACGAAAEEGADALVLDLAGPVTYTVQGRFLTALAERGALPEPREDPEILAGIYRVTHTEFGIERVRVLESDRADIGIRLELEQRDDDSLRHLAQRLDTVLTPLLPGGVELSAVVLSGQEE